MVQVAIRISKDVPLQIWECDHIAKGTSTVYHAGKTQHNSLLRLVTGTPDGAY